MRPPARIKPGKYQNHPHAHHADAQGQLFGQVEGHNPRDMRNSRFEYEIRPPSLRGGGAGAAQLRRAGGVSWKTVRRAEAGHGMPRMTVTTLVKVQAALEAAGVEFIAADGSAGVGVRMRQR